MQYVVEQYFVLLTEHWLSLVHRSEGHVSEIGMLAHLSSHLPVLELQLETQHLLVAEVEVVVELEQSLLLEH